MLQADMIAAGRHQARTSRRSESEHDGAALPLGGRPSQLMVHCPQTKVRDCESSRASRPPTLSLTHFSVDAIGRR